MIIMKTDASSSITCQLQLPPFTHSTSLCVRLSAYRHTLHLHHYEAWRGYGEAMWVRYDH